MKKFNVTFETITPDSASLGDTETSGFYLEAVPFREAFEAVQYCDQGHQADCYPANPHHIGWITAYKVREDFRTGETENRSIHFPDGLTFSTKKRILKLFGIN